MIKKLQQALPGKADGIVVVSPENRRYFTSFPSSDGILIVTKSDALFLTDSRYIEAAQNSVKGCRVKELKRLSEQIPEIYKELGITEMTSPKFLVESDLISVSQLKSLRKAFSGVTLSTVGGDEIIRSLREIKTSNEINCIIAAQRIAEGAFNHILNFIKHGVSEKDIALELDFYMLKNGAEALSFETIAISGAKTSMPHGVPDENTVKSGDFVTMDFGAVVDGYHSDMTRTVAVGKISDKQIEVYNTVLKAQQSALECIKSGIGARDADAAARDVIESAGYGQYFRHSTGHGVGIEIHETPNLSPNSQIKLAAGNIVTVEPGIYIPGEFGVRIEDMVCVTEDGCINLTNAPKNLIYC